jgi:hypothetical protein
MKFQWSLLISLIISPFYSCVGTDVPISYNTNVLNSRILGFWQLSDSAAMSCTSSGRGDRNDKISFVRVCGNIVGPDNSVESFYNYARRLSASDLFLVRLEEEGWKICGYFR